jgi:hypothetical protein
MFDAAQSRATSGPTGDADKTARHSAALQASKNPPVNALRLRFTLAGAFGAFRDLGD